MKAIKYYSLRGVSVFDQLCFEELVMRHTNTNCFVFNYNIPDKHVVMGFSGKPELLVNIKDAKRDNLKVIRRYTGGGTVLVDKSTVFGSLICNSSDIQCNPYPREIMKWSESIYGPAFNKLSNGAKFRLVDHDYAFEDKKVGGNAQAIIKDRWVHHTSFLYDFDDANMAYLQVPSKRPEYRKNRGHLDFITRIKPHISSVDALEQSFVNELARVFDITQDNIFLTEHFHKHYGELLERYPEFVPRTVFESLDGFEG